MVGKGKGGSSPTSEAEAAAMFSGIGGGVIKVVMC